MEFPTRKGTDNPGLEYEKEIAALLAVRYAFEESVHDFWIATNVDCVGDTDDVVLCITPQNGEKVAFLLQLKHENPVGDLKNFKEADFTYSKKAENRDKAKERFSVDKYFRGYKMFHDNLKNAENKQEFFQYLRTVNKFVYVLYTNRGLKEKLNCLVDASESDIFDQLNTSKSTYYGFNAADLDFDEDFLHNLYLFPNQINIEGVFNLIKAEIRKLFGSHTFSHVDFDDVTKRYLEIIKLWAKGCVFEKEPKYITLTKEDVINILSDILLESYKYDIEEARFSFYDCQQKDIWNKCMLLKDISVVYGSDDDDLTVQFLKDYIGSEVKSATQKQGKFWKTEVAKVATKAFFEPIPDNKVQMMKICGNNNNECITMITIYKFMWFYKNLPMLLEINDIKEYNDILKILEISKYKLKVIVITSDPDMNFRKINQIKYFGSLKDLEPPEKEDILNLTVQFQGRIRLTLSELVKTSMLQNIKCVDIIHILCNDFNVGNRFEFKCNYYIDRSVSKILISFEALVNIENEFFLIEADNKEKCERMLTEKLSPFDFKINNKKQIFILESKSISKKVEKMKMAHDCFHRMLFHEDFLEWIESNGNTAKLIKFQIVDKKHAPDILYEDVPRFLNSFETNKFQIISACPGMGKSVLLNYITCFATSCVWILPVILRRIRNKIVKEYEPSEFFTFYLDEVISEDASVQNKKLSLMVFEDMLKRKKVLLLLDGFDEISISKKVKDKFLNLIKYFQMEKFPAIITTRENMKYFFENNFNIISKNLKSFTLDEQRQFLTNFFELNVTAKNKNSNKILLDFVEQLLIAAKHNLTDRDAEFTGVPLQLQLLANYFLQEFKKSIKTKTVVLTTKFDLLDLYNKFITNKTSILCEKYGESEEDWLETLETNQQLFALQYLFDDRHLKDLDIKNDLKQYYAEEERSAQFMQRDGILIAIPTKNKINIDFIHLTFAEFLAAQWLTKNVNNAKLKETITVLLKLRFEGEDYYTFLFAVFDRILAKQCPIHLDIINIKVDEIKLKFESDPNIFASSDATNRTAFHIFGLYANDYKEKDLIEIFDTKLLKNMKLDTLDNLTRYSALDYALFTRSWTFANILCELSQYLAIRNYELNYSAIDNHHLKYKFLYLTIFHNHLCRDMLIGAVQEDTQIMDYARELSNNIWISKNVFDFVKSVSTLGEYLKLCGIKDATKYYYNDIRFAIAFGSKENIVNLLSAKKININEKDTSNAHTLLHYATIYKRSDVVEMLLSKGADVNIIGRNGSTVVHEAACIGYMDILEMYIAEKPNLNQTNNSLEAPLDIALRRKHANVAKALLRHNAQIACSLLILHDVVKLGDIDLLQEFLEKGFDINETYFNGNSPLHTAIQNNRIDMAKMLINHNCDITSDTASDSFIHLIAKIGNVELLNIFLERGVNIDKQNKIGETPLMIAIDNDHTEFVKILISNNADVLSKCKYGDVFSIAISKGNEEVISQLIEKGCDVNRLDDRGNTPLLVALKYKKLNIAKLFLQNNAGVNMENSFGYTTLHYAAMHGYKDLVVQLLGYGVNINKKTDDSNSTALLLALEYVQLDVAKLLISSNAEVNIVDKNKCNTLHYAAMHGDITVVQDLIAAGEELNLQNDNGFTPFQLAIENDKSDIIKLLLSYDVTITPKTKGGKSTLHIASSVGNDEIIRICLENNFDINEKDSRSVTPLFYALRNKKFETARLLIRNGADIRIKDTFLDSALHYAARVGNDDFVLAFLNEGLDINEKNTHSETPLSIALMNDYLSTAQLLHKQGALIDIKMLDRSTTLHLAASCGYNELVSECIHNGYNINTANFDCDLPIDFAIMGNKYETVKLLIESGAIPSMRTLNLYINMKVQSEPEVEEKIKYFKLLLDKFSNINLNDKEGNTILHYVCNLDFKSNNENGCENFYREAVAILVHLGANFETKNKQQKSAYDLAVENNLEIILQIFDQRSSNRMDDI